MPKGADGRRPLLVAAPGAITGQSCIKAALARSSLAGRCPWLGRQAGLRRSALTLQRSSCTQPYPSSGQPAEPERPPAPRGLI